MITTVGPIDFSDGYGKEVVVKMDTTLASGSHYYTDSNGLEFAERTKNMQSSQWYVDNPISGNFYPISMAGYIT